MTRVHKADSYTSKLIPDLEIVATEIAPRIEGDDWREKMDTIYGGDAKAIATALVASLPGATVDRLLIELLTMTVCLLRRPFEPAE
jgi:TctA family transporter